MKNPILTLSILALTLSLAASARAADEGDDTGHEGGDFVQMAVAKKKAPKPHAKKMESEEARRDAAERAARKARLEHGWDKMEERDAAARHAVKRKVKSAWEKIEEAAEATRAGISDALRTMKEGTIELGGMAVDGARGLHHDRPLLFSDYIDVVKKGDRVSFVYCD